MFLTLFWRGDGRIAIKHIPPEQEVVGSNLLVLVVLLFLLSFVMHSSIIRTYKRVHLSQ